MSNLNSRIDRLKAMLSLEEKRTALLEQLDTLQQQLDTLKSQLFDESPVSSSKSSAKAAAKVSAGRNGNGNGNVRSKRGALKEQILAALSNAGHVGIRVTELAGALGTKAANVHAWFHSTGKRIPGLTKVSGGHYRLKNGSAPTASAPAESTPVTKTASPAKLNGRKAKGKGKTAKRGELSENIVNTLTEAGDEGLTIKDLSEKIGANYRNVSVWFVTTGKKFPKIKKIAPAHYKIA